MKCNTCEKYFKYQSTFQNHIESVHQNTIQFMCQMCCRAFNNKTNLETHIKIHAKQNFTNGRNNSVTLLCEICDKSFQQKIDFANHMNIVHGEKKCFKCQMCGMRCKTVQHLKNHTALNHGILEVSLFKCDVCERKFRHRYTLIKHIEMNHDDSDGKFRRQNKNSKSNIPMEVKKILNTYQCDICETNLVTKNALKVHIIGVHQILTHS